MIPVPIIYSVHIVFFIFFAINKTHDDDDDDDDDDIVLQSLPASVICHAH